MRLWISRWRACNRYWKSCQFMKERMGSRMKQFRPARKRNQKWCSDSTHKIFYSFHSNIIVLFRFLKIHKFMSALLPRLFRFIASWNCISNILWILRKIFAMRTLFVSVKALLMETVAADIHHISFVVFAKNTNSGLELKAELFRYLVCSALWRFLLWWLSASIFLFFVMINTADQKDNKCCDGKYASHDN